MWSEWMYSIARIAWIPVTFSKAVYRVVRAALLGRTIYVPFEVQAERMATCSACLLRERRKCGVCGCKLMFKTSLASEECPDLSNRQWDKYDG